MSNKSYVGDYGTVIELDTKSDILDGETLKISVMKPGSSSETQWDATKLTTTKIGYTTVDGDFNVAGTYQLQAFITSDTGSWRGETVDIIIYDKFK